MASIKTKDILNIGFFDKTTIEQALIVSKKLLELYSKDEVIHLLKNVFEKPEKYLDDTNISVLAQSLLPKDNLSISLTTKPYTIIGKEIIEKTAITQMDLAMSLPISCYGVLCPDAHSAYSLPVGGVLATEDVVIPGAIGNDISCRMSMYIYDLPGKNVEGIISKIRNAIDINSHFGLGGTSKIKYDDSIMDRTEWNDFDLIKRIKDKCYEALGTQGSGNHFFSGGIVTITDDMIDLLFCYISTFWIKRIRKLSI